MVDDGIDAYIPEAKYGILDKKTGIPKPEFMNPDSYTTEARISLCARR